MHKQNYVFVVTAIVISVLMSLPVMAGSGTAAKWNLDNAHSSVNFSIKHFFTPVNGKFDDFKLDLNFDPNDLEGSSIAVEVMVASVNTGNEKRDGHLQSADFFGASKHPVMTFNSTKITSTGDNNFVATGKLKIKDVEKEVKLPFSLLGVKTIPAEMKKMIGADEVASFQSTLKINRNDYTVGTGNWAATLVVGDEVNINVNLEVKR